VALGALVVVALAAGYLLRLRTGMLGGARRSPAAKYDGVWVPTTTNPASGPILLLMPFEVKDGAIVSIPLNLHDYSTTGPDAAWWLSANVPIGPDGRFACSGEDPSGTDGTVEVEGTFVSRTKAEGTWRAGGLTGTWTAEGGYVREESPKSGGDG
jgi:hypothetical protein